MALSIEIVSPHGVEFSADGVERVVVRRREPQRSIGSEIAIYPRHAPLLMRVEPCTMRYTCDGVTTEREIPPGVLEVFEDRVTIAVT